MPKRVELHQEKKKPNFSIPVGETVYRNYPIYCSNNFSSVSREITLFMKKCIEENKIEEKYLEEPKKERFSISVEDSIVQKFVQLCEKYKQKGLLNYNSTPLLKRIIEQLEEKKK
jgi:hypothetical protein